MVKVNRYSGYIELTPESVEECEKAPWQLLIDTTLSRLTPAEKALVLTECKYIVEELEKEKENVWN